VTRARQLNPVKSECLSPDRTLVAQIVVWKSANGVMSFDKGKERARPRVLRLYLLFEEVGSQYIFLEIHPRLHRSIRLFIILEAWGSGLSLDVFFIL